MQFKQHTLPPTLHALSPKLVNEGAAAARADGNVLARPREPNFRLHIRRDADGENKCAVVGEDLPGARDEASNCRERGRDGRQAAVFGRVRLQENPIKADGCRMRLDAGKALVNINLVGGEHGVVVRICRAGKGRKGGKRGGEGRTELGQREEMRSEFPKANAREKVTRRAL
jgi:hypothetical protein